MFDVGFWELAVIGVIALVILGPERLPKLARTAGMWIGRARRMVADVKEDISREMESDRLKEVAESFKTTQQELQATASGLDKNILGDDPVAGLANNESVKDPSEAPKKETSTKRTKTASKKKTSTKSTKTAPRKVTTAAKKTKAGVKKNQAAT